MIPVETLSGIRGREIGEKSGGWEFKYVMFDTNATMYSHPAQQ
jgi:hypothetical protein